MIFYTSLTALSSFVYIDEPVTFLLYDLFNIFLLNDVDIQLILKFLENVINSILVC